MRIKNWKEYSVVTTGGRPAKVSDRVKKGLVREASDTSAEWTTGSIGFESLAGHSAELDCQVVQNRNVIYSDASCSLNNCIKTKRFLDEIKHIHYTRKLPSPLRKMQLKYFSWFRSTVWKWRKRIHMEELINGNVWERLQKARALYIEVLLAPFLFQALGTCRGNSGLPYIWLQNIQLCRIIKEQQRLVLICLWLVLWKQISLLTVMKYVYSDGSLTGWLRPHTTRHQHSLNGWMRWLGDRL